MATSDTSSETKKRKDIFEQGKEWMKRASKRLESKKIEPQSISNKAPPITLPLPASSVGNPRMFSIPSVPHVITEFPRILPPLKNNNNNAKSSPLNIQKEHEFSSTPPAIITNQKNNLQLNDVNSSNNEPLMDFNLIEDLPVPSQPLSSEEGQYQVIHLDSSYQIPSLSADHTLCYCNSCAPHLPSLYYSNISPLPPKDSSLLFLSTELIAIILKFAGWKSTLNFSQTCQYFRVLSRSDLIWRHFCNIYHKSRTKPSTDNVNTVSLHHGTKYYNLFVKFSTSLPKHAHTTSFQNITNVFGNDEVGFKFKFQFNNIKSNDEQNGFALKYVPKKWVPKRLRCPMWIISPISISSEILDDVMETFDHSWEEFISSHERFSESDSNSDSDGSTSEEHSGPRSSNLNASMDRVLWPLEPEFEWISEVKGTRDIIVFRFLEDIFAVQCLCIYELKKQKTEAIIRTLQM